MREIKFRAWENGKMYYGNEDEMKEELYGNFVGIINEELSIGNWMQYTGLKDKNGKEIFEGDIIVSYCWDGETQERKYEIKFSSFTGFFGDIPYFDAEYSEVIGNIYEGVIIPELLSK